MAMIAKLIRIPVNMVFLHASDGLGSEHNPPDAACHPDLRFVTHPAGALAVKLVNEHMSKTNVTIYGLATCDTTRAARKWLDAKAVKYAFHDVREDGLTKAMVEGWVNELGWEKVLNKASTTWRELPEKEKTGVDAKKAIALLLAHPTLVKRPVLDRNGQLSLGFKPESYAGLFV
ncbi:MAG TPA: arsenate reductase [Hyphomonadaceae bacterium]|nr:arsenate reductase [Hyphomonadaceae bacterium]